MWIDLVPVLGDRRVIDLHDQPGVDDRLVFLAQYIGPGVDEFLFALVVLVAYLAGRARGRGGNEPRGEAGYRKPAFQVRDVGGQRLLSGVGDRAGGGGETGGVGANMDTAGRVLVGRENLTQSRRSAKEVSLMFPGVLRTEAEVIGLNSASSNPAVRWKL